jgi:hypothetical protein
MRRKRVSELLGVILGGACVFVVMLAWYEGPQFWRWFKYSVWKDLNYAQGYRKGLADGRAIARRSENE